MESKCVLCHFLNSSETAALQCLVLNKKLHSVSLSCVGGDTTLTRKVRGEWPDWSELTGRYSVCTEHSYTIHPFVTLSLFLFPSLTLSYISVLVDVQMLSVRCVTQWRCVSKPRLTPYVQIGVVRVKSRRRPRTVNQASIFQWKTAPWICLYSYV